MCRWLCTFSNNEQTHLLNVVSIDDDPENERIGSLCGREVYCSRPTSRSQYCHLALVCATMALGMAGAIALPTTPQVGKICLVCAGVTYVSAIAQVVLANMHCIPN
jgi:hypothetical protein